jgi:hypothetical protein
VIKNTEDTASEAIPDFLNAEHADMAEDAERLFKREERHDREGRREGDRFVFCLGTYFVRGGFDPGAVARREKWRRLRAAEGKFCSHEADGLLQFARA